jgi:hypothetical protein
MVYAVGEKLRAQAKAAIQTHLRGLFPDFPMKKDFLFGPSGRALEKLYGLNPWRIRGAGESRFGTKMKAAVPRLRRRSIERLWEAAGDSIQVGSRAEASVAQKQLDQLWRDLEWAERRCGEVGAELKRLYDQAQELDPRLPDARPGVVSQLALARLVGERGPLSDFKGWRELQRYVGLNLRERQSGQYGGNSQHAQGRPLARILNRWHCRWSNATGSLARTTTLRSERWTATRPSRPSPARSSRCCGDGIRPARAST